MIKEQIKYVAVDPDGTICGPVNDSKTHVKHCLEVGARRAGLTGEWQEIEDLGYSIRLAKITLLDD